MRSISGVILTLALLGSLAYASRSFLPYDPVFTIQWNSEALFVPLNMAAYWACLTTGVFALIVKMIRAMMGDMDHLR